MPSGRRSSEREIRLHNERAVDSSLLRGLCNMDGLLRLAQCKTLGVLTQHGMYVYGSLFSVRSLNLQLGLPDQCITHTHTPHTHTCTLTNTPIHIPVSTMFACHLSPRACHNETAYVALCCSINEISISTSQTSMLLLNICNLNISLNCLGLQPVCVFKSECLTFR